MKNRQVWLVIMLAVASGLLFFILQNKQPGGGSSEFGLSRERIDTKEVPAEVAVVVSEPSIPQPVRSPQQWLRGRVQDQDGRAIPDARVTLNPGDPATSKLATVSQAGEFVFPGEEASGQLLVAEAAGFLDTKYQVQRQSYCTIVMPRSAEQIWISGTVLNTAKAAPVQFEIQISFRSRGSIVPGESHTFSGGSFFRFATSVENRPGQQILLQAVAPGYQPVSAGPFEFRPGKDIDGVEILLKIPAQKIAGVVYGESVGPIEGATVIPYNDLGGEEQRLTTDPHGYFELLSSRRTVQKLVVMKSGYAPQIFTGEGLSSTESWDNLSITLERGGTIFGHVVDVSGAPIPGTTVHARSKPDPGRAFSDWQASAKTDANGQYRIVDVPVGAIFVGRRSISKKTSGKNLQDCRQFLMSVTGAQQEDFVVYQDAILRGRVRFTESPTLACWVELYPLSESDPKLGRAISTSHCDQDSEFVLECFSGAPYILRIFIGPNNFIDRPVQVDSGALDLGELRLNEKEFQEAFLQRRGG